MIIETNSTSKSPFSKRLEYIENNILVGYLEYSLIYNRIEINNIFVKENFRNKKIGTKLLEHLINIAKDNMSINITLEVRESNAIAIHLYTKFGFINVATRKHYYGKEDAILMKKEVR